MKKIFAGIIIAALIICGAGAGYFVGLLQDKDDTPQFGLTGKINKISELSTIEYSFNYVGKFKDSREIGNTDVPLTEKSFVISIPGTIKYHVDLSKVKKKDIKVRDSKKLITINMPKMESDAIIDMDKLSYYDKTNNLFNAFQPEDSDAMEAKALSAAQKQAEERGIIKQGQTNAENIIRSLVNSLPGYADYDVKCNF